MVDKRTIMKMKNIIVLLIVLQTSFFLPLKAQIKKSFLLSGSVSGKSSGEIYLRYRENNKTITDSTQVRNGKFTFSGLLDEPTIAELSDNTKIPAPRYKNLYSDFYIEPSKMNVSLSNNDFSKARLTGSQSNNDYQTLNHFLSPVLNKISGFVNKAKANGLPQKSVADSITYYNKKEKDILLTFIHNHRNSFIAVKAVQRFSWFKEISADSSLALLNSLNASVQMYNFTKVLKSSFIATITSSIGHQISDFTRKDENGKAVKLSSFKGKYVLLDFWASWCVPCRELTPHIKSLYAKYHSEGLIIIAVSCDLKYEAWQNAIRNDGMDSLVNILSFSESDMSFLKNKEDDKEASFKGELRKQFDLKPIPVEILIDKKGFIVGRYGAMENQSLGRLNDKLVEIFGNN